MSAERRQAGSRLRLRGRGRYGRGSDREVDRRPLLHRLWWPCLRPRRVGREWIILVHFRGGQGGVFSTARLCPYHPTRRLAPPSPKTGRERVRASILQL